MGLSAVKTNGNQIFLQFYALNDEDYFSGYFIYIATTIYALQGNQGFIVQNSEGTTNKPTIFSVAPMSSVKIFTYTVTSYTNNQALIPGTAYYFEVKAYSDQYNSYSDPSNITNVNF